MLLVTGGAGFIGSNFINKWLTEKRSPVLNLDCLTYAAEPANVYAKDGLHSYTFVEGDICDRHLLDELFRQHAFTAVVNFAAESHVDRSIADPTHFVRTNVLGTFTLLDTAKNHWASLDPTKHDDFRFLHVSTDEVYGTLDEDEPAFTEQTPYDPRSPYSASKAASDHIVSSYFHTYGMPTLISNCSNNYGPYQYPEKLIPVVISKALAGLPIPIYGDGSQIRDWLHVDDHCDALNLLITRGVVGTTYNIGGQNEVRNLKLVQTICAILDEVKPRSSGSYQELIEFVVDRKGHDRRYAVDISRINTDLGWRPKFNLQQGLRSTIAWYIDNAEWVDRALARATWQR